MGFNFQSMTHIVKPPFRNSISILKKNRINTNINRQHLRTLLVFIVVVHNWPSLAEFIVFRIFLSRRNNVERKQFKTPRRIHSTDRISFFFEPCCCRADEINSSCAPSGMVIVSDTELCVHGIRCRERDGRDLFI